LAEIAVLKNKLLLAETNAAAAQELLPQFQGSSSTVTASPPPPPLPPALPPPPPTSSTIPGKVIPGASLNDLALPLNQLEYRTVDNLPSIRTFDTPRVGAWDWVTTAEGELAITKVITTLLQRYAGSDVCGDASLFLDVGANSG
jgi:hypothetical protein